MTSNARKTTGKSSKIAKAKSPASEPFRVSEYLRDETDIAYYLEELLADGDPRVITIGLRHVADAVGGMSELARRTGLARESLYRTLAADGNPRLSTLTAILKALHLRLAVAPEGERLSA
ncbi:MAG: putative addiction module antidote protein [Gammaproteobacteria bacterium]|nr:putative addiction module antidote protein [Gammaproteobacteria bacterium]